MIQTRKISLCRHGLVRADLTADTPSIHLVATALGWYASHYETYLKKNPSEFRSEDAQRLSELVEAAVEWNCLLDEVVRMGVQVDASENLS